MAKGQKSVAADLEKILEKLQKLDKLDEKLTDMQREFKTEFASIKKDLKDVQHLAEDNKQKMEDLEGSVQTIQRKEESRETITLNTQLDRLSYFLRFQNVEEVDQEDLRDVMVKLLSDFIKRDLGFMNWDIDLVYRVNSQYAITHNVPREVHIKFVRRETRDEILRNQRLGALIYRGKEITILKQIPRQVREIRRKYYFLSNKLYLKGIGFRWLMPEGLMIFWEGSRKRINNVAEAKAYLEEHKTLLDGEELGTEEGEVLDTGMGGAVASQEGERVVLSKLRPRKK